MGRDNGTAASPSAGTLHHAPSLRPGGGEEEEGGEGGTERHTAAGTVVRAVRSDRQELLDRKESHRIVESFSCNEHPPRL